MEAYAKVNTEMAFSQDIWFVEEHGDGESPNIKDGSHLEANALETFFQTRDIHRRRSAYAQIYQTIYGRKQDTHTSFKVTYL